jgi:hypothetical protein
MKLVCKNKSQPTYIGNALILFGVASQGLTVPFLITLAAATAGGACLLAYDLDLFTRRWLKRLPLLAGRSNAWQIPPFLLFSKLHPAVFNRRQMISAALSGPLAHDS